MFANIQSSPEPLLITVNKVFGQKKSLGLPRRDLSVLLPNWLPSLLLKSSYILTDHAGTYLLPAFSTRENLDSTRLKWQQEMLYTVKGRIWIETPSWALPVSGMKDLQLK